MRAWLAGLALAALAGTPLPPPWKNWQYSRAVTLAPAQEARLVRLTVPREVYAHASSGLADLRLMDDRGQEVPFLVWARLGRHSQEWRDTRLYEVSFLPGQYTQAFLDTGETRQPHSALLLETDEKDFSTWVELAVSENARDWRVLRQRVPLYRFAAEGLAGNLLVNYSESFSRYLRVRVLQGGAQFSLTGARVAREEVEEPERVPLRVVFLPDPTAPAGQSWWRADLGADTLPVSTIRLQVAQAEFHRPVQVSTSPDGKAWRTIESGSIYRYRVGGQAQESLEINFGESPGRYWRVAIFNRNDPPLEGVQVDALWTPRHLVFRQTPGQTDWLLYGNVLGKPPDYELARLLDRKALEGVTVSAPLGEEETNPAYEDPRPPPPWTERHSWVLGGALLVAVAVLALLAFRALRLPTPTSAGEG